VRTSSEWTSVVSSAEEKRANFCKGLDGKQHFNAPYDMYTITLKELKAVLNMTAQDEQSGEVNKNSVESTAQDDDFQEVKRRKRHICNCTPRTAYKSTKAVPTSAAVLPKAVLTLRTSQNF
jgi:hypothetical protein